MNELGGGGGGRPLALPALLAALLFALTALGGCDGDADAPSGPTVGTNSNWLRACADDDPCGDPPECHCGACTQTCTTDADCDGLETARCSTGTDLSLLAECGSVSAPAGICLPRCAPGECDPGQACVGQACVLAPIPDVEACDGVADREQALRAREETLLAALVELRTEGGATCGGNPPAAPAPGLRFDPRLLCAARVLADDVSTNGVNPQNATTDSLGRDTQARLLAAGYTPMFWADGFAIGTSNPAEALQLVRSDPSSCQLLTDPTYTDVAVGVAGDVTVFTLATP